MKGKQPSTSKPTAPKPKPKPTSQKRRKGKVDPKTMAANVRQSIQAKLDCVRARTAEWNQDLTAQVHRVAKFLRDPSAPASAVASVCMSKSSWLMHLHKHRGPDSATEDIREAQELAESLPLDELDAALKRIDANRVQMQQGMKQLDEAKDAFFIRFETVRSRLEHSIHTAFMEAAKGIDKLIPGNNAPTKK
jgi:hypothetical protein